jgi:hypothetical protein
VKTADFRLEGGHPGVGRRLPLAQADHVRDRRPDDQQQYEERAHDEIHPAWDSMVRRSLKPVGSG